LHKNRAKEEEEEEEKAEVNLGIPPGCRRLIIAKEEINFTISDVKYVVDCGKSSHRKHKNQERTPDLERIRWIGGWSSENFASQRAECAGRAQAREYYFLGAKKCFGSLSPPKSPTTWPARSGLRQACLYVKRATSGTSLSIAELFAQTYKPPLESSVRAAVDDLKELQVLDEEEELTALGHLVADLDMDPCFGKMVVLGICLDPMLILASLGWNALPLPRGLTGPIHLGRTVGYHVATIESFRAIREMLRKGELSAFMDEVSKDKMSKLYHTVTPKIERIIKTLIAAKLLPADSLYGDRGFYSGSNNFNAGSRDNTLIRTLLLQCLSSNLTVKPFREKTIKYKSGKTVEKGRGLIKSRDRSLIMVSNFGWP
jgi:HrpA-like RNA helicase